MSYSDRYLIVTHQGPDLDACGSVWLLQRFAPNLYANAQVAFVDAGQTISTAESRRLGYGQDHIIHVDTGLGEFDHHQPERAMQLLSASLLIYQDLCQHYPHLQADSALRVLVEQMTEIDHFKEVEWPDASNIRYSLMLHELIGGFEHVQPNNDDVRLRFCFQALDAAYAQIKQNLKAAEIIAEKGVTFELKAGQALAIETGNDETISLAQKQGYVLVVKKDPSGGFVRIKARPDSNIIFQPLYDKILTLDQQGTWYYHQSGKMLLNSSRKNQSHKPTPLSLSTLITLIKELYG